MSSWRWFALGFSVLAIGGCHEPSEILTAAPPGAELPRDLPESEKDNVPQAIGEELTSRRAAPKKAEPHRDVPPAPPTAKGETKTTARGVKYQTLEEGTGKVAKAGDKVRVHYTGTLENGEKFDSSHDRGTPYGFTIGGDGVIEGWNEGVAGMRVGERRKLTIPPALAYKEEGKGSIPGNSTLVFEVELVGIE